ncbi:MAG: PIN domain-containing protein [Chloroflexi bacterium]|nr:PIN domain-containing protein [Chloroflexota bacterium]
MRLVDTNVLLYAASLHPAEQQKTESALNLLRQDDLCLSVQVLQEFYYQATRPSRLIQLNHKQALDFLGKLAGMPVQPLDRGLFLEAVDICQRFQLSYWDAAILATARRMNCDAVYSEDLSDQQDYAGLRVINPFSS